jgi:heat shock protein HslJ
VASAAAPTLAFTADSRVYGKASCNRFTAGFALTGETLTVERAASTMMACAEPVMEQELRFLELLRSVQRFTLAADGALTLHAADGRTIVARRG